MGDHQQNSFYNHHTSEAKDQPERGQDDVSLGLQGTIYENVGSKDPKFQGLCSKSRRGTPHEPAHGERDPAPSAPEPRVGPGWGLSWRRTPLSHTHSGFSLKRRCRRGRARNADKLPSREGSPTVGSGGAGCGGPCERGSQPGVGFRLAEAEPSPIYPALSNPKATLPPTALQLVKPQPILEKEALQSLEEQAARMCET